MSFPAAAAYAGSGVEVVPLSGPPAGDALPDGFDYYVATYRYGMNAAFPGASVVHEIGRDGAVFTTIKARPRAAGEGSR